MQVLRDHQIITGFIYEDPIEDLPALTHCGEALCCAGHTLPYHAHSSFEFLYLSRGSASWQDAAGTHLQRMGDLFIAYPQVRHATGPRRNPENQHVWLGVNLGRFGAEGRRLARRLLAAQTRILPGCQELEPVMRAVVAQVVALRPRRAEAASALIRALIELVSQRVAPANPARPALPAVLPYSVPVQRSLAYMRQNLDRRVPLRDLAGAATVASVSHFCSRFRAEVGVSPAAYHGQLRLEAARSMLRQPAFDITTAAHQAGFSSAQHFSTAFRRAYGVTPRAWRRSAPAP